MLKRISNFLKDLLLRSPLTAATPHVPHPPEKEDRHSLQEGADPFYQETSADLETVAGTEISFGTVETTTVDQYGNATHKRRRIGHLLGGRLVTSLESRIENGLHRPGVGGICRFCLQEAIPEFEAGQITLEALQSHGLFNTAAAAQCEGCGCMDICNRHCRPLARLDGSESQLCPTCREAAMREDQDRKSICTLLSPWLKQKQLPPSTDQEVQP